LPSANIHPPSEVTMLVIAALACCPVAACTYPLTVMFPAEP
jgi:hypothetical protein